MVTWLISLLTAVGLALLARNWLRERADRKRLAARLEQWCKRSKL